MRVSRILLESEVRARRPAWVVVSGLLLFTKGVAAIFASVMLVIQGASDALSLGLWLYGLAYLLVARPVFAGRNWGWYAAIVLCVFDATSSVLAVIVWQPVTILFWLNAVPPFLCMATLPTRSARDWFSFADEVYQALRDGLHLNSSDSPSSGVSRDSAC